MGVQAGKKKFEKQLAHDAKKNPKPVYKYINARLKTRSDIPDLDTSHGRVSSDSDKTEALNNFFSSVFTHENPILPVITPPEDEDDRVPELLITEEEVLKKQQKLKVDKSPGPDGLHPKILRETAEVIYKPLTAMMQISLDTSTLPACWKEAHVTAIHKKGN